MLGISFHPGEGLRYAFTAPRPYPGLAAALTASWALSDDMRRCSALNFLSKDPGRPWLATLP